MIREILFVLASAGSVTSNAPVTTAKVDKTSIQETEDISGYYTCKGVEAGGKPYSGVAVITKKGEVYLIQWMVGGGSTFSGVAIRQGTTFSASWALPGERGLVRGVNMYRIESGPRLVGRWATLPGGGVLQNETLTFLKNLDEDD